MPLGSTGAYNYDNNKIIIIILIIIIMIIVIILVIIIIITVICIVIVIATIRMIMVLLQRLCRAAVSAGASAFSRNPAHKSFSILSAAKSNKRVCQAKTFPWRYTSQRAGWKPGIWPRADGAFTYLPMWW